MPGELVPKVRLVTCPKCREVLPENPEYNVYKCGGCGTILQAKKRRSAAVNSESSSQEIAAAPRNGLVLKTKANSFSSAECSSDANAGRGQIKNGEGNGELLGPFNLSDEELENELDIYKLSHRKRRVSNKGLTNKTTHCEIEEINSATDEDGKNEKSAQVGIKAEMEIIGNDLEGAKVLNNGNMLVEGAQEELISGSDDEDGSKDKSDLIAANREEEIAEKVLEGAEELNNRYLLPEGAEKQLSSGSDGEDANANKLALPGANLEGETSRSDSQGAKELHNGKLTVKGTDEDLVSRLDADNDKSALVGANLEVEVTGRNKAEELNNEKLLSRGAKEERNIGKLDGEGHNNEQSVLVAAKSEVDIIDTNPATKRSSTENFVSEKGSILLVTPDKLEEGSSSNPASYNKQPEQAHKNIHHSQDHARSVDTLDSPEPGGVLGGFFKSQTTRRYYGNDGSASSYDGKDKRFPIQRLDSYENTNKVANGVSEGRSRKGKGLVNSIIYGDHRTQHQPYLPNGKHHVMKTSNWNENKVLESTTYGHQHRMKTKRVEFTSRIPFHQSGSRSHYESRIPSNQIHDEMDPFKDNDQENLKLLGMIQQLQDQLDRTLSASRQKHIPAYHSHDLHEGRRCSHGMDHPMPTCNGRCDHGVNWHQRHKFSRIPYSAEATSRAHHADHSCFHCCPHKQHFSADLLQHEGLCRSCPCQDCCSYNSTPERFKPSKLPLYGHETKSDYLRHLAPEVKKHLKWKHNSAKRYFKPVAGGAPFVTCYKCLKLLQLPADVLLFKRVCHQIKCGECYEVLKFSMHNGSHIVSFSPSPIAPPSSDIDNQKESMNSNSNLPSTSHANYYNYTPADAISYSQDYGLHHVSKSYSSEGEPLSRTQVHPLNVSEDDAFFSEGKKITSRHSSTSKAPVGTDESADHSSNMTVSWKLSSHKEARQPRKSSSLLKLMGYYSPSQVIRGSTFVQGKTHTTQWRK